MHEANPRRPLPGEWLLEKLVTAELWMAAVFLVVMVAINVLEVTSRYLFHYSFIWVQDVTVLLAAWMIFLGFTAVVYHGRDISVTFLLDRLPLGLHAFLRLLGIGGALMFLGVTVWKGMTLLELQRGDESHMAHVPIVLYTWPLIVGAATLFLVRTADLIRELTALIRGNGGVAR